MFNLRIVCVPVLAQLLNSSVAVAENVLKIKMVKKNINNKLVKVYFIPATSTLILVLDWRHALVSAQIHTLMATRFNYLMVICLFPLNMRIQLYSSTGTYSGKSTSLLKGNCARCR